MSQSIPAVLVSDPVFDPMFLDIPFLQEIPTSPSGTHFFSNSLGHFGPNAIIVELPTGIQHDAHLAFPGTSEDYQPPAPLPLPNPLPPSIPAVLPLPPPPPPSPHIYHRINTTLQHHIVAAIESHTLNGKKSYKCIWPNCPFITHSKPTSLTHARKHFGNPKFYACSCGAQFACKESAKRHCDTRNKVFECALCLKKFTRKDYRLVHQRKCDATPSPA